MEEFNLLFRYIDFLLTMLGMELLELLLEDRADGHTGLHGPVSC